MKKYVDYFAVPTLEVASPFSFKPATLMTDSEYIGPQKEIIDSIESRLSTFRPYDIYCFTSQLEDKIKSIKPSLSLSLVHKRDGDTVRLFVELREGASFFPITVDIKPILETMVRDCATHPHHFLLFRPHFDLYFKDTCVPYEWIVEVLPYIEVPSEMVFRDSTQKVNRYFDEGGIFVSVDPSSSFESIANVMRFDIYKDLVDMYQRGYVVLSSIIDMSFINAWQLERANPADDREYALHKPTWRNVIVGESPSQFLTDRLLGEQWCKFVVGHDEVIRYNITKALRAYQHVYCDKYLMVIVDNIQELCDVSAAILTSKAEEIDPNDPVSYYDVHRGTIIVQ